MVIKESLPVGGVDSPSNRAGEKEFFGRLQGWRQEHNELSLAVQKVKASRDEYSRLLLCFQDALGSELASLGVSAAARVGDLLARYRDVSGMLEEEHSMLLNSLAIAYGSPLQMESVLPAREEASIAYQEYEIELRKYLDGLEKKLKVEVGKSLLYET